MIGEFFLRLNLNAEKLYVIKVCHLLSHGGKLFLKNVIVWLYDDFYITDVTKNNTKA